MIVFPELPGPALAEHSARHLLQRGCSRSAVVVALVRWLQLEPEQARAITDAVPTDHAAEWWSNAGRSQLRQDAHC